MNKQCLTFLGILVLLAGCRPVTSMDPSASIPSQAAPVESAAWPPTQVTVESEWTDLPARLAYKLTGSSEPSGPIVFSPLGDLIVTGGAGNLILLWDGKNGNLLKTLSGHQSAVTALAFSRDGTLLVSGSDDQSVRLWDVGSGEQVKIFEGSESVITAVDISPDNKIIASGSRNYSIGNTLYTNSGQVRFWNAETGELISAWNLGDVSKIRFHADGSRLTALMGAIVYKRIALFTFYAPFTEEPLNMSITWGGSIRNASAYLPGQNLYVTGNYDIQFWNADTGEQVRLIRGLDVNTGVIVSLEFSPDERIAAGMCTDGIIRFWDVSSGRPLGKLPGSKTRFSASFSPDGRMIATVDESNAVLVWILE